ncbi:MAG: diacylglycerol kinase family lipid kinase [Anaerolineae bacterium]|nr:diacylglycerol kinase family lipid kinase [Anaerolineae bacterium]
MTASNSNSNYIDKETRAAVASAQDLIKETLAEIAPPEKAAAVVQDRVDELAPEHPCQIYVVLNPMAGQSDAPHVRQVLQQFFANIGWTYTLYETTGQENLGDLVRSMVDQGYDLFVAIGGDGTISGVATGLVNTGMPLAIVPLGTGNALARELDIPQDLEAALQLLLEQHTIIEVDVIQVEERFFALDVSVGFSSFMLRATSRSSKRKFGRLAYVWAGLKQFIGFQPERFSFTVDGQAHRGRAAQLTVANASIMGGTPFRWGPHIRLDDGRLDLCLIRARTMFDYLRLAWNLLLRREASDPNIGYLSMQEEAVIESKRPLPVEGDGEIIGQTPVRVQLVPHALRIVVPKTP